MSFELDIGIHSVAGRHEPNEDCAAAQLPRPGDGGHGAVLAIADGVSTGGLGQEAARSSVAAVLRGYYDTPVTWDATVALDRIITAHNRWLAGLNRQRLPPLRGLTTLTTLVLRGHGYTLAHVGDTRAYLLRAGELTQLTHDHALPNPDFSHQLLRCLGQEDPVIVDHSQGDLVAGDALVLLTDGVHGSLNARRLHDALRQAAQAPAQTGAEDLVAAALARGSRDNATALVVKVLGLDASTLHDEHRHALHMPVPPKLQAGDTLDGLTVTALLADNGIHRVYQVQPPGAAAPLVLKALHPQRAHDPEERTMLAHEAWLARRMAASSAASHLVALHDTPQASAFYLLYDWHAGETLDQPLARGQALPIAQVLQAVAQAARALGGLHRQGVIHRDVKPANLHQGADGVLRLLDLGVALSGHESATLRALHAGTPSYVNPEQWGYRHGSASKPADEATEGADAMSDLFALGVTLYQLLTRGKLPYGEVLPYQAGRYWHDPMAPSRHNPEVPIWLDHIALKAVARDKRQRFETAEELLLALERGASRPLTAPAATPLIHRDPTVPWKLLLGVSATLNALLVIWLLFLPR